MVALAGGAKLNCTYVCHAYTENMLILLHLNFAVFVSIIIGSDRRPETKQGIEGKIDMFRSGRLGIGLVLGNRYN